MSKVILAFNSFFVPKGKITALHSLFFLLEPIDFKGIANVYERWGRVESDRFGLGLQGGEGLGDGQKQPLKLYLFIARKVLVRACVTVPQSSLHTYSSIFLTPISLKGYELVDVVAMLVMVINKRTVYEGLDFMHLKFEVTFELVIDHGGALIDGSEALWVKVLWDCSNERLEPGCCIRYAYCHENYVGLALRVITQFLLQNGSGEGQWRLEEKVQDRMGPLDDMNDLRKLSETMPRVMCGKLEALIDGINTSEGIGKVQLNDLDEVRYE
ncbi:hypothetical protein Tco_1317098 [Tanacetum coccineum]